MSSDRERTAATLERVNQHAKLSLALDETIIRVLEDIIDAPDSELPSTQIGGLRALIREHRVGIIKQRAMMGAVGINV